MKTKIKHYEYLKNNDEKESFVKDFNKVDYK